MINDKHTSTNTALTFPCEMLSTMGIEEGFDPAPKLAQCRKWGLEKGENE